MDGESLSTVTASDVVARLGSQASLARICGVTQQSVSGWCLRGALIPPKHVLAVEAATGVPKEDLRPDIYPRDVAVLNSGVAPSGGVGGSPSNPGAAPTDPLPGFAA